MEKYLHKIYRMIPHEKIANDLIEAEKNCVPIEAPSKIFSNFSEADGQQIQKMTLEQKLRLGNRLVGFKLGLTSREAQKQFNVFKPDYGYLLSSMAVPSDSEIKISSLIHPMIEAEIAFVLGKDLKGPYLTWIDLFKSVEYVVPALEIVDCRIRDWRLKSADLIADNACSAFYVLGATPMRSCGLDLSHIGMALSQNGEIRATGVSSAVMGNPLNSLAFLANELALFDTHLHAGDTILSGSLSAMLNVGKQDCYTAEFSDLGSVSVHFTKNTHG